MPEHLRRCLIVGIVVVLPASACSGDGDPEAGAGDRSGNTPTTGFEISISAAMSDLEFLPRAELTHLQLLPFGDDLDNGEIRLQRLTAALISPSNWLRGQTSAGAASCSAGQPRKWPAPSLVPGPGVPPPRVRSGSTPRISRSPSGRRAGVGRGRRYVLLRRSPPRR